MAFDLTVLNGHLTRIVTDLPQMAVWKGQSYTGVKDSSNFSQVLELGGLDEKIEYTIYFKISDLPTILPKEGDQMTIDGIFMKVLTVKKSPDNNLLSLGMGFARA